MVPLNQTNRKFFLWGGCFMRRKLWVRTKDLFACYPVHFQIEKIQTKCFIWYKFAEYIHFSKLKAMKLSFSLTSHRLVILEELYIFWSFPGIEYPSIRIPQIISKIFLPNLQKPGSKESLLNSIHLYFISLNPPGLHEICLRCVLKTSWTGLKLLRDNSILHNCALHTVKDKTLDFNTGQMCLPHSICQSLDFNSSSRINIPEHCSSKCVEVNGNVSYCSASYLLFYLKTYFSCPVQ